MDFRPAAAVAARANFDGFKTAYKTVGEHAVTVDVLVPKGLKSGVRPLLVRFHGGGLVGVLSLPLCPKIILLAPLGARRFA